MTTPVCNLYLNSSICRKKFHSIISSITVIFPAHQNCPSVFVYYHCAWQTAMWQACLLPFEASICTAISSIVSSTPVLLLLLKTTMERNRFFAHSMLQKGRALVLSKHTGHVTKFKYCTQWGRKMAKSEKLCRTYQNRFALRNNVIKVKL